MTTDVDCYFTLLLFVFMPWTTWMRLFWILMPTWFATPDALVFIVVLEQLLLF